MKKKRQSSFAEASGLSGGLFLMAVFTTSWSVLAFFHIQGNWKFSMAPFWIFAVIFFRKSAQLSRIAKTLPVIDIDAAQNIRKKYFNLIFILEGIGILVGINIVTNLGRTDLVIPTIALVVGLHFFGIAWIFRRKIDTVIATSFTFLALFALILQQRQPHYAPVINICLPTIMALATAAYGTYMLIQSQTIEPLG